MDAQTVRPHNTWKNMKYIVRLNPKYEGLREWVERVAHNGMPEDGEVIYRGRNILYRADATLAGNRGTDGGNGQQEPLMAIVKEFRKPNIINSYVYTTVRTSKAARSFYNAMKMTELGFLTPEPIAYAEVRDGLKLISSCYICRELTGAKEMRHWEDFPNADTLVPAFAKETLRLHRAGVLHKDFSPGNRLYTGDADNGYSFYYVDLNRMKFNEHRQAKLMTMFRSINLNPEETRKLARHYAEASGENPERVERLAIAQLNGYFAKRKRKQKLKSLIGKDK